MLGQTVLCLPRECIANRDRFTHWQSADWLFDAAQSDMTWLPRQEAEDSYEYVQPIPCALILGEHSGYHVFRRIKGGRADLSARLTLVVGGHIESEPDVHEFGELLSATLQREIDEELNVTRQHSSKPVGVVIDQSSLDSSRHIGIVHEVVVGGTVKPVAYEEFAPSSTYAGRLCQPAEIASLNSSLDPWSSIIFSEFVATSFALEVGLQLPFPHFVPPQNITNGRQTRLL